MAIEMEIGEPIVNPDFTIIGKGNIGEKARQLLEKTPKLKSIGFTIPHRTLLAEGFLDRLLQHNDIAPTLKEVEASPQVISKITSGNFPDEARATLQRISHSYGNIPLMVRSSAEGDARGTGTYTSELTENKPELVGKALQKVLVSYFSESAIAFRRDAQTGEGFGVMIEPVVGQHITQTEDVTSFEYFAPILSGFGYTSTSRGEGYVNAVPGLGGGVDTRNGERLDRKKLEPFNGNLDRYLHEQTQSMVRGHIAQRSSALLDYEG